VSRLTAYLHPKCSTCQRARQWLAARGVDFAEKDIRATPPSRAELRTMLAALGGKRGKLFNTSGLEYRGLGLAARLPGMGDAEAFALLAGNGMLVKRPFLLGSGVALVGFDEEAWAAALAKT
jgi:arsenate reductase